MKNTKEIDRQCSLCEKASVVEGAEYLLCPHAGAVDARHSCGRFSFDPFKLAPRLAPVLPSFDPEEMAL